MRKATCLTLSLLAALSTAQGADPLYDVELSVARQGFDRKTCWVHARAGVLPPGTPGNPRPQPRVIMTTQKLLLTGSDVFYALNQMSSEDAGHHWTEPVELASFARQPFSFRDKEDLERTVCDFTPAWHQASRTLLGLGHTVVYENNRVMHTRPRATAYAVFDAKQNHWSSWRTLDLPDEATFENAGSGSVQRVDLPDGTILLPIYHKPIGTQAYSTSVLKCAFDGETLRYLERGTPLSLPIARGLYEPSLAQFGGRYFLTLRNDVKGYVARSEDGLTFSAPKPWTFDDGELLGNYNTQQHWVTHSDALFLVYTRKGADNDHVFRHRAPLFIARVDPDRLHVIRDSEQVLVPEKGARLGNFGVTRFSENETWVTVAEWMQTKAPKPHDPEKLIGYGADNRIWIARLKWKKPNSSR